MSFQTWTMTKAATVHTYTRTHRQKNVISSRHLSAATVYVVDLCGWSAVLRVVLLYMYFIVVDNLFCDNTVGGTDRPSHGVIQVCVAGGWPVSRLARCVVCRRLCIACQVPVIPVPRRQVATDEYYSTNDTRPALLNSPLNAHRLITTD